MRVPRVGLGRGTIGTPLVCNKLGQDFFLFPFNFYFFFPSRISSRKSWPWAKSGLYQKSPGIWSTILYRKVCFFFLEENKKYVEMTKGVPRVVRDSLLLRHWVHVGMILALFTMQKFSQSFISKSSTVVSPLVPTKNDLGIVHTRQRSIGIWFCLIFWNMCL